MEAQARKACKVCGVEKPLSNFRGHPSAMDGHIGICKTCYARQSRTPVKSKDLNAVFVVLQLAMENLTKTEMRVLAKLVAAFAAEMEK